MDEASSLTTDATALHLAIKHGNAETLSRLLNEGSSVTAVEQYGCTALHIAAIEGKVKMLPILLDRGSSITAVQMYGYTALLLAAEFGTVEMVSILLDRGSSVTAVHVYGWTALHLAAKHGTVEMLSILLDRDSSITAVNDDGWTALHIAVCSRSNDTVEKVKLLLAEGAIVNTPDKRGRPELHIAARNCSREVVKLLLDVGANIDVVDTSGNNALSYMLLSDTATFDEDNVAVACFLCSKGSKLKPLAEMPSLQKHQLGLLTCIQYWQQRYEHHPLIEVPSEVVNGGEDAVKTYLAEMEKTNADDVVYRRKICVVGPTTWGKSSLARSMIEEQPILVPLTNRTTGIDLFSLSFTEEHKKKRHDITFWDFAGQDVYHVAHAVFFSTRALYLVCINLKAYADMLEQVIQESKWEREDPKQRFFEENILRWMLLILIRQPDAQFKLIGTKADLVNPPSLAKDVIDDVRERLNAFLDNPDGNVKVSPEAKTALRIEVKGDFVATALSNEANGDFVAASVESIQRVKDVIKDAILAKPDRSFQMPTSFTQAFAHIIDKRRVAAASATQQVRMDTVIMPVSDLCRELMRTVGIDRPKTCKEILRTLHELGDVLWYADIGDEFKELVILDPTVMLDLVREVINHNYKDQDGDCYNKLRSDGTLQHSLLITFPAWKALDSLGGDLVRLFKRLLLRLNLVYPVNDLEDLSEADMIVPTYWKLREQAARPSLPRQGTVLKQNAVNGSRIAKMRYSVPIGVPDFFMRIW